jgi:hypothetical protein
LQNLQDTGDALVEMTGGAYEEIEMNAIKTSNEKDHLWHIMFQSFKKKSILFCSNQYIDERAAVLNGNGIQNGHAYTITKLICFNFRDKKYRLVRLRNPLGKGEWKGAWSDNSSEWNILSEEIKKKIELVKAEDGEFWMSVEDFFANFNFLELSHMSLVDSGQSILDGLEIDNMTWKKMQPDVENGWKCSKIYSEWCIGKSVPQFLIKIETVDVYDRENKAAVIISLREKDRRRKKFLKKDPEYTGEQIEFKLMKVKANKTAKSEQTFKKIDSKFTNQELEFVGETPRHVNFEFFKRFTVVPGLYVIIPISETIKNSCEFLIRIFTEQSIETR